MWEVLLPLISFWMSFRVTPKKIDALLSEKSGAAQNNAEFAAPEAVRAASVQLTARAYKDLRDYMDEVYLLAKNGAQVLHPTAVRIAQRCAISIRVANYLNPRARDTLVSNCPPKEAFLAVTEKPNGKGFLTTLLHRMPLGKVFDILHRALDNNRFNGVDEGITSVLTDKNVVQVQSQQSLLRTLYDAFCTL